MNDRPELTSRKRGTYKDSHQTPDWIISLHRELHGHRIDLDLASSDEANRRIQALTFYSRERPCPRSPRIAGGERIWCNPPGPGQSVRDFWATWCRCIAAGADGSFLAFCVDHARRFAPPPCECWVGLLRKRVTYLGNKQTCSWPSALISTRAPRSGNAWTAAIWWQWYPSCGPDPEQLALCPPTTETLCPPK